jgi:hypothetical protein
MVDWSLPLEAVDLRGAKNFSVAIDPSYSRNHEGIPVRFHRNVWTGDADGGTWYFNNAGQAIGGMSEDGYNGRYILNNRRSP